MTRFRFRHIPHHGGAGGEAAQQHAGVCPRRGVLHRLAGRLPPASLPRTTSTPAQSELTGRQNTIRKALHPEYYGAIHDDAQLAGFLKPSHVAGCVDALRQALECGADVGVLVWQRDGGAGLARPRTEVAHTCRDFGRVQEWARRNRAVKEFDFDVKGDDAAH
jgi:hypothetical protein